MQRLYYFEPFYYKIIFMDPAAVSQIKLSLHRTFQHFDSLFSNTKSNSLFIETEVSILHCL